MHTYSVRTYLHQHGGTRNKHNSFTQTVDNLQWD